MMQNVRNTSIIIGVLYGILAILFGILIYILFNERLFLNSIAITKITDIFQIFVTIIISLYLAQYLTLKTNNHTRRREVLHEQLCYFSNLINSIYDAFLVYKGSGSTDHASRIKSEFKLCSAVYSILKTSSSDKNVVDSEFLEKRLKEDFLLYKSLITDSPFDTKQPSYDAKREEKILLIKNSIQVKILQSKINLFR